MHERSSKSDSTTLGGAIQGQESFGEHHTWFAAGFISSWIENYARLQNLPASELAGRVGELLFATPGRSLLGPQHRLPTQPGPQAAQRGKAARKVAVDGGARRNVQRVSKSDKRRKPMSDEVKARLRAIAKKRWRLWKAAGKTGNPRSPYSYPLIRALPTPTRPKKAA